MWFSIMHMQPRLTHEAPFQVEKTRIQVQQLHNFSREQQGMPGPTTAKADLDIPESVGLYAAQPSSVKRLIEPSSVRRSSRRRLS